AAMAKAAGYAHAYDFAQLGNFEQQAGHVLKQEGPVFATLRVVPTGPLNYDYPRLYDPARRKAIKDALRAS
ncbi:MAG: thiamine pyrophosphate-binding protein, partial [Xanthobacteraceae bacterium]